MFVTTDDIKSNYIVWPISSMSSTQVVGLLVPEIAKIGPIWSDIGSIWFDIGQIWSDVVPKVVNKSQETYFSRNVPKRF